jgi:S-DNA-T family DNA segregation ATPase FtsK/SpoIIIE
MQRKRQPPASRRSVCGRTCCRRYGHAHVRVDRCIWRHVDGERYARVNDIYDADRSDCAIRGTAVLDSGSSAHVILHRFPRAARRCGSGSRDRTHNDAAGSFVHRHAGARYFVADQPDARSNDRDIDGRARRRHTADAHRCIAPGAMLAGTAPAAAAAQPAAATAMAAVPTPATVTFAQAIAPTDAPASSAANAAPAEPATPPDAEAEAATTPTRPPRPNAFEFHAPASFNVELPTLDLLEPASDDIEPISEEHLAQTGQVIEQRLQEFKVPVTVVGASAGPVITRFEIEPALGVRGSQIVGLMKDLSRGLGLTSIRVVETIPGKTCMGLELPNAKRQMIRLSEISNRGSTSIDVAADDRDGQGHHRPSGRHRSRKAPHMLVAGTTGSGKSVAINAMILSLLYKATPEDVRLIMIDPKMLELSVYEGIPHLLAPVVTDMKLAANALNWCVGEMEKRYRLMSAVGVRNLAGFNQKIRDAEAKEKKIGNPFSLTPDDPEPLSTLPLIVVVIDELADLMMVAGKKIEELIARLAQKARAAGIHLILATQRPSVDVITGLIKANIPTRVAFQVSSKIDSRTILDQMGAESLLGQGDMLFLPPGTGYRSACTARSSPTRKCTVVEYLKQFGEPQYEEGILDGPAADGATQDLFGDAPDAEADPLYDEAVAFVVHAARVDLVGAAPAAHRLQPRRASRRTDGSGRPRVADGHQRQPRGARAGRRRLSETGEEPSGTGGRGPHRDASPACPTNARALPT